MTGGADMEKVSVIIPVYNVAPYLRRCVESVLCQSYENKEIILVDDGSTDGCDKICDEYGAGYSQIRVLHKKNGGLASARNAGLDIATGDYIEFLDSDDWIAPDTIGYCMALLHSRENIDVVQFGIAEVSSQDEKYKTLREHLEILTSTKDILWHLMYHSTVTDTYYSVCRCIFLRELTKNLRFPEGKINEDIAFKYKLLQRAGGMIDSNQIKYFYFQASGSITTGGFRKKDFDLYDAAAEIRDLTADETYRKINVYGKIKYARTSLSLLCKISYFGFADDSLDKKETVRRLRKEVRQNLWLLLRSPMKFSRKVLALSYAISFRLTDCAVKLAKKL